jgi:ComF family protein
LAASIVDLKTVPRVPARLHDAIHTHFLAVDAFAGVVIIPIPLSRQRQHERGFNQAEVIADAVGRIAGLTVDRSSLVRKLNTPAHRIAMDQRARELSVDGAFEVLRPKLVKGRRVLLVDDVLTSGSTASSCAKVLKKNGAGEVNVFTLARAVMH